VPDALARSQAALLRLGVFRSVSLRLQEPETPLETKDLLVELVERPYATLTQSGGFSLAEGPRAEIEYTRPNVLGRAIELTLRGKVNYPINIFDLRPDLVGKPPQQRFEGRADTGLRWARVELLPFAAGGRSDLVGEVLHRRAYDLKRGAGVLGIDVGLSSRIAFALQYDLEVDDIRHSGVQTVITQADLERLRFDEGVTTLHSLRPTVTFDYRDNSAHPHRGWFASGSATWAHSLGDASTPGGSPSKVLGFLPGSQYHTNLVKLWGTLSGYLPVGDATVLALSLRGGRVFPLDPESRTIVPMRFFLGGASTMRGYADEEMIQQDVRPILAAQARQCATSLTGIGCTEKGQQIASGQIPVSEGGEAFILWKAELRVAITRALEIGLFADLGNLWLDPTKLQPFDVRVNAGFGLRFVTPIGPAALDFGWNVQPDTRINERSFAPNFAIGLF
ncbi:MAG TPA: BamA/TamA family outer membrane protein, partial [Anaeromyxobacter sp.]|nr:BamA/TamA family outer membrane protein [Anaeromyxobacter sp.]